MHSCSQWSSYLQLISYPGREGTLGYLLHQSPKFYINVFMFVGLTFLGTLVNFDWLIQRFIQLSVQNFQPLIQSTEEVILCIIIGDIHQFIGHCLIPVDLNFLFRFLICLLNNFGDYYEIYQLIHLVEYTNVLTNILIYKEVILCIIIGDIHQ